MNAPSAEAFFLATDAGARFCLYHAPQGSCRGALLYVHPFGEEMNKSRRMAALQARALAALGYGVLQLDLHGCGDSAGDFGEARWDGWKRDLDAGCAWLHERLGLAPALWGLRLGALLALDYAHGAALPPPALLLWQPVHDGGAFLTQFLRLRMAADMLAGGAGPGTAALRATLQAGEPLEVAGYELAPALAAAIDALRADALPLPGCPVYWLEVVADGQPLPAAAARVGAGWRAAGVDLRQQAVPGAAFWATPEVSENGALLAATGALLAGTAP